KAEEITERSRQVDIRELGARIEGMPDPRPFADALRARLGKGDAAVIAEIKRASPSRGVLREHFDPAAIARDYEAGGAAALSVLTDRDFFQGADEHLANARAACSLPVLRKDFTIDAYQVYEARALGADCVLVIVAALGDAAINDLAGLAVHLGMDVLVEVHDASELERVLHLDRLMLGINSRDLRTFETRLDTIIDLLGAIPDDRLVIAESGIHTPEDVRLLREHGVHSFLVGEAFMRAEHPGERLAALFDLG
ncbi:MAG: indole-3-glycerol phosphate synthase TrpC, partial [Gammaproteobacteria bacterium]|nr:indole-3-glycerol phosphate synthase TrpC [Gammaproteobacteria bacterium]NIP90705.1 indole-3-glycerol phosphate synthase TrpC [Gammaproteobacteria bacterium]NIR25328.1 indole-3-glycerol phosphate synthase TrpC [Gammaproteobacteria bacterium]NIS07024.1 indole-3-glycerol phosphate synthase TrpC [Gammaproteobacteria bacterium]NIU41993.1 indole-3-glycerol phosphate synthase TrpC [Gammaproteobacteria bacterium]